MPVLVDIKKCTGCGICVPLCSEKAITIIENKAVIEDNSCNECLQCMYECPPNAIYQIIDSKSPVIKREDSLTSTKNQFAQKPMPTFWTDDRKQKALEIGEKLLSGMNKIARYFLNNKHSSGKSNNREKKGHQKHRRGHKRGRR